ncbi:uncharacterized protein N7487_001642 [Penicillium crustosum]|uniref:uncharacterized protein n=1 Tax=Penicillium crustosum TaxID=36656 RepID=UPI00239CE3F3|nr:uncharacterized protein N7487_001642 [Penicillium crustosum]KAJ5418092.1 hypothetical protein N7487_001642 [Penicillium crustosum]
MSPLPDEQPPSQIILRTSSVKGRLFSFLLFKVKALWVIKCGELIAVVESLKSSSRSVDTLPIIPVPKAAMVRPINVVGLIGLLKWSIDVIVTSLPILDWCMWSFEVDDCSDWWVTGVPVILKLNLATVRVVVIDIRNRCLIEGWLASLPIFLKPKPATVRLADVDVRSGG